jgi:DNA-binding NarL/FixJ family response regulator
MTQPTAISMSRHGEQKRGGERGGESETSHVLHARAPRPFGVPSVVVVLGGVAGAETGEALLTLSPLLADTRITRFRAWTTHMQPQTKITVVIAHFDDLLARGLRELIESDPSLAVVAADVEHRRLDVVLRAHHPDVAILDAGALVKLADIRQLSCGQPATRLVVLARDLSRTECAQLLAFGASACLGSDVQSRDVLNAIHLASRGLQVLPRMASQPPGESSAVGSMLTRREAEVLPLLQLGRSNAQIALTLQVGIETVRTHARNIYRKLGVSSRRELIAPPGLPPRQDPSSSTPSQRRRTATLRTRPRRGHGLRHLP